MASEKISALAALGTAPASTDLLVMVDVSDTSMAPTGTTKRMTVGELIGSKFWELNGNTVGAIKTIGTIDAYALPFITNNVERARIDISGNFGIGTASPTQSIHTTGNARIDGYLGVGVNPSTFPLDVRYNINDFTGVVNINSSTGTNAATAFFATNNTGKNIALGIGGGNTTAYQNDYCNANEGFMALSTSVAGFRFFGSLGGAKSWRFYSSLAPTANPNFVVHSNGSVGVNIETPTAIFHVVGGGSTSATYGLKVQNSSAALSLQVRDDRQILVGSFTATEGSALTGIDSSIIYVTSTNGTFTSVGFWGYENGAWVKL